MALLPRASGSIPPSSYRGWGPSRLAKSRENGTSSMLLHQLFRAQTLGYERGSRREGHALRGSWAKIGAERRSGGPPRRTQPRPAPPAQPWGGPQGPEDPTHHRTASQTE